VERLIFVGDLTHSIANRELDLFMKWRKDFSLLHIDLVKGNHDILKNDWYEDASITVSPEQLTIDKFCFRHDAEQCEDNLYTFSGHVHPGISIRGRGQQSLSFPCFYFGKHQCILPAFSRFTGTYKVKPEKGEVAYAIVDNTIMKFA
jgi:DNA ligase-associated metallophosphoesterase